MADMDPSTDLDATVETFDGEGIDRRALLGRAAAVAAGSGLLLPNVAAALPHIVAQRPRRGGYLTVGLGAGSTQGLDPHVPRSIADHARNRQIYNTLAVIGANGQIVNALAESIESNRDLRVWTVRLRRGITWHDGTPLRPADVAYSFRRIVDPQVGALGASQLNMVDPAGIQILDRRTIRFRLKFPTWTFREAVSSFQCPIIKAGTREFTPTNLNGTGPFKASRVVIGQRTDFVRNANYWVSALPYLGRMTHILIPDPTARINALLSGQVLVIDNVPTSQIAQLYASDTYEVLRTRSGGWQPINMDCTKAPFTDVRVRQAMRLIAGRPELLRASTLGFGKIGNDLFGFTDPLYAGDAFPQRTRDIERARSLLRQAGQEDLTVNLDTSTAAAGMAEQGLAFAQQARQAGVTINVVTHAPATYFANVWMKTPFNMDSWARWPLDQQIGMVALTDSPFNETGWKRPAFDSLVAQARRQADPKKRKDMYTAIQRQLYDQGGYIVAAFPDFLDGYHRRVRGLRTNPVRALGFYDFTRAWIA